MDVKVEQESWAPKNWCFWTVVLEKTVESPLDSKEIRPVLPKGNQSWIFTGRTDVEYETLILWLCVVKNWLIGKDPDSAKDWGLEEMGMALPAWWTWVWVNSRRWWWTGKPGMLQSLGSQRVRHDWATELNSTSDFLLFCHSLSPAAPYSHPFTISSNSTQPL